jgi:hypothetical protein
MLVSGLHCVVTVHTPLLQVSEEQDSYTWEVKVPQMPASLFKRLHAIIQSSEC